MSFEDILKEYKQNADVFYKSYINPFQLHFSEELFNKFRLFFLNMLSEDLVDFFDSPSKRQRVMNIMQVGFNIWSDITKSLQNRNEIFIFFFMAACFIGIQLESKEKVNQLKNWACNKNIDLNYIFKAEKLMLNKVSLNLYLYTSEDCAEIINNEFLNKILLLNKNDTPDMYSFKEIICTWREFALYEYSIYQKYDSVTITFSSFYIGLLLSGNIISKDTDLMQEYEAFIKTTNIVSHEIVQQCSKDIYNIFQLSDTNQDNDAVELKMLSKPTRANSDSSLNQVFTQYDKDSIQQYDQETTEKHTVLNNDSYSETIVIFHHT